MPSCRRDLGRHRQHRPFPAPGAELTLRRRSACRTTRRKCAPSWPTCRRKPRRRGAPGGQDFELANVEVKAPVDGTVVGLAVFTQGGVVAPGFKMMDIVPTDDPLVVEGQLPVNLVDKVHPGLKTELIFSAFNANRTPHIPGEVETVSADRTVDERTGAPFYKVRVKVTPEGREDDRQPQDGHPFPACRWNCSSRPASAP
jgi:protease secretion system membrane fusion protein